MASKQTKPASTVKKKSATSPVIDLKPASLPDGTRSCSSCESPGPATVTPLRFHEGCFTCKNCGDELAENLFIWNQSERKSQCVRCYNLEAQQRVQQHADDDNASKRRIQELTDRLDEADEELLPLQENNRQQMEVIRRLRLQLRMLSSRFNRVKWSLATKQHEFEELLAAAVYFSKKVGQIKSKTTTKKGGKKTKTTTKKRDEGRSKRTKAALVEISDGSESESAAEESPKKATTKEPTPKKSAVTKPMPRRRNFIDPKPEPLSSSSGSEASETEPKASRLTIYEIEPVPLTSSGSEASETESDNTQSEPQEKEKRGKSPQRSSSEPESEDEAKKPTKKGGKKTKATTKKRDEGRSKRTMAALVEISDGSEGESAAEESPKKAASKEPTPKKSAVTKPMPRRRNFIDPKPEPLSSSSGSEASETESDNTQSEPEEPKAEEAKKKKTTKAKRGSE